MLARTRRETSSNPLDPNLTDFEALHMVPV